MEQYKIIQHHGVKGMRWGIRKANKISSKQGIQSTVKDKRSDLSKKARLGSKAAGAALTYKYNKSALPNASFVRIAGKGYGMKWNKTTTALAITGATVVGHRLMENRKLNKHIAKALNTKISSLDKKDLSRVRKEIRDYQQVSLKDRDGKDVTISKNGTLQTPSRSGKKK